MFQSGVTWIATGALLFSVLAVAADLLPNGDFSKRSANGTLMNWALRGERSAFEFKKGTVRMVRSGGENVILQQNKLPIEAGKSYRFSCEVVAPKGTDYMIYYEALIDGKFITEPVVRKAGRGELEKISMLITKPANAKSDRLMIRLMNQSAVSISNLQLKEESEAQASVTEDHGIFFDSPSPDRKDVLFNGNFERGPARWELFRQARVVRTNENLGNRALELTAQGVAAQKGLYLESATEWRLTFFAKITDGDRPQNFRVFLRAKDWMENQEAKPLSANVGDYQRYELRFRIPGDGERKDVDLFCENLGEAPLLLDEFYLDAPPGTPLLAVTADPEFFRGILYDSLKQKQISGSIESTLGPLDNVTLTLQQGDDVLFRKALAKGETRFSFPVAELPCGDYRIVAEAADGTGRLLGRAELPLRKLPRRDHEVLIDGEQNFLVDGRRFYPIALLDIYDRPGVGNMAYAAGQSGVNSLYSRLVYDEAAALKALDYAESVGLKSILCIGGFKELAYGRDFKRQWREKLESILTDKVINHKALLLYEYGDEGVGNDIPDVAFTEAIKMMNEIDPWHPVFLNESPRGTVVEYLQKHAAGASAFGVDIYPLPESIRHSCLRNKKISCVGEYADLYAQAAPEKPLLFWLQAFDWGALEASKKTGLPTVAEQRFMNFDALLHHVKGIIYYNDGNDDQAYYNDFFPTVLELAQWEQIVHEGEKIESFQSNDPDVLAYGFRFRGEHFYIVLNRADQMKKVELTGLVKSGLFAQPEGTPVASIVGKMTLELPPFALRLFADVKTLLAPARPLPPQDPAMEARRNDFFTEFRSHLSEKLGGAKWIWFPGESRLAHSQITARRTFQLDALPAAAVLYLSVDDAYRCLVNGKLVKDGASWAKIGKVDVAPLLKVGENTLEIEGRNEFGRCGMIAKLILTSADGSQTILPTDDSWQLTNRANVTRRAEVLGDFGASGTWTWMRMGE